MHLSCLVISADRPDADAMDEILWPWCSSNDERERDAKLDYWDIGGRFAYTFSLDEAPAEIDYTKELVGPGNQLRKKDVPFEHLAARAATATAAVYDQVQGALVTRRFGLFERRLAIPDLAALEAQHGLADAHRIFNADPAVRAIRRNVRTLLLNPDIAAFAQPREAVVAAARRQAILTHAVVEGDRWHEAEDWIVQGGPPSAWDQTFNALLDATEPDWWLTLVDFHR